MEVVTQNRLTTTVEEDRSRQELLDHYVWKEEMGSKLKVQLERELGHVRREREKELVSRTEVLNRLKLDLIDVKEGSELKIRQLRSMFERRVASRSEEHSKTTEAHKQQLAQLQQQLDQTRKAFKETEDSLRKQKLRRETDVELVIKNYDSSMEAMASEFSAQKNAYSCDWSEVTRLDFELGKVDAEHGRIAGERRVKDLRDSILKKESDYLSRLFSTLRS
jgi:hypothetical protein